MTSQGPKAQYEFEIDASVVYQLGEMLISDEVQALLELVKNSYDADATYANIVVRTDVETRQESLMFPQARGYIVVEDDGTGMGWQEIKQGWLTISNSPKREMKQKGQTTARGRTPIGDKGLGRLGTQRLGRYLEFWSKQRGTEDGYYVGIDWGDFKGRTLSQVPAYIDRHTRSVSGTKLIVSGLRAPAVWEGNAQLDLVKQLSQLISPFQSLRPFAVFLDVNGARIDLDEVSQSVLDIADLRVGFIFDGSKLTISGAYRPTFLRSEGQASEEDRNYQELIAVDKGADFFAYLVSENLAMSPTLLWDDRAAWLLSFEHEIELRDIGEVSIVEESAFSAPDVGGRAGTIASPGPFEGEIYVFSRKGVDLGETDIFNKMSEFRRFLDRIFGVRVFRDGFGIRPFGLEGDDWLGLGKAWTSGTSWYGLRPKNTVGYVALTAEHNSQLEETTSREYFVENAYSRNFYRLMQQVVGTINGVNEKLRREYTNYRAKKSRDQLGITSFQVGTLFTQLRDAGARSQDLAIDVAAVHHKLETVSRRVEQISSELVSSPLFFSDEQRQAAPLFQEIGQIMVEAQSTLHRVNDILSETERLGDISDVLQADIENLRNQLVQFSELAGLGLTAEALAHEMKNIADGLAARTTNLMAKLRTSQRIDPQLLSYTEFVHSAVAGFRKQLSHLDPSLRYVREQREVIPMLWYFRSVQDFYKERLERSRIRLVIQEPERDFSIMMNRGKLTQVIDNLILNSEYWLQEDLRKSLIDDAQIIVRIAEPFVEILDTGRGIPPAVEHQLFQPFVTTKPQGVGHGLGLFINRQLLDASNCQISLLPTRNGFNRRFIFRIDFSGALHND